MKKSMLILGMLLITISVSAQWYHNYNVTNVNELTKEQCDLALQKANKLIKTGKTLTIVGAGVCIVGAIMYSSGLKDITSSTTTSDIDEGLDKGVAGAYIAGIGGVVAAIGIPVWISGGMRKDQIEIALKKFDTTYNNTTSFGIGIKVTF